MKLGKEEIQKLVLGLIMAAGVVYSYFALLLGPLQTQQATARKSAEAIEPEIVKAKLHIKKAQDVARSEAAANATVTQIGAMIPEGSPVAWFPPRIADIFKAHGVDKAGTRLNNEIPEKELPGFRRLSWGVELPKVDFNAFAAAVAQIENDEPLTEIASLQVNSTKEDAESQNALLNLYSIVKQ